MYEFLSLYNSDINLIKFFYKYETRNPKACRGFRKIVGYNTTVMGWVVMGLGLGLGLGLLGCNL